MALTVTGLSAGQLTKVRAAVDELRPGKYNAVDAEEDPKTDQEVVDDEVTEHLDNLHVTADAQKKAEPAQKSRARAARTDLGLR